MIGKGSGKPSGTNFFAPANRRASFDYAQDARGGSRCFVLWKVKEFARRMHYPR
jgi:hypothetical protein